MSVLSSRVAELLHESEILQETMRQGVGYALPTPEEEAERARLHERAGQNAALIAVQRGKIAAHDESVHEDRQRIVEKVRLIVQEEAARRDSAILTRLADLTQEVAQRIGTESISDVACSSLGRVTLRKHGASVSFTGIHNEGERLRVKLAFFLAMMRLGRERGYGRHPGFLLIDQPGSGEMVPDDFNALAAVFRRIDADLGDDIQILCFTARPEFYTATAPDKVYGGQGGRYAF
jgi:hypothetical protein